MWAIVGLVVLGLVVSTLFVAFLFCLKRFRREQREITNGFKKVDALEVKATTEMETLVGSAHG